MITVIAGSRGMLSGKAEADNEIGQKPSTTVVISLNLKKNPFQCFQCCKIAVRLTYSYFTNWEVR